MMRSKPGRLAATLCAATALASCSSGSVGQYPITTVNPVTAGKLQFSIGWATTYTNLNPPAYGLNFVETFRQSNGRSAVQTDTPSVVFPQALNNHLVALGLTYNAQFAAPLAALGAGINSGAGATGGDLAKIPSVIDSAPSSGAQIGVGGPPAFPAPADSTSFSKLFSEGYYEEFPTSTVVTGNANGLGATLPEAEQYFPGTYKLLVTIPTGQKSTVTTSATATLGGAPLPAYPEPAIVLDGSGGALVTLTVPAGVTETLVTILTTACAPTAAAPSPGASPSPVVSQAQLYTLISHVAGPGTDRLTLPDFIAPNGSLAPYHSICSKAEYPAQGASAVNAAGFDYPAFESVYPQSFSQAPTITGTGGRSDITISAPLTFTPS
jgi:hypothetical protein